MDTSPVYHPVAHIPSVLPQAERLNQRSVGFEWKRAGCGAAYGEVGVGGCGPR
jgi:hypothetical protein